MEARQIEKKTYGKDFGIGVLASVVATVIIWIIQWIFQAAPQMGHNLPTTIENIIYAKASSITSYSPFLITAQIIRLVILSAIIGALLVLTIHTFENLKKVVDEKILGVSFGDNLTNVEKERPANHDDIFSMINELKQLEQEEIRLKKEIKGLKKRTWIMVFLTIGVLGIILSVFQMFVIAPIELRGQFELELQVLSPYLEKETLLDLQSDWVLMKSKDDYLAVHSTIDRAFEELGIG